MSEIAKEIEQEAIANAEFDRQTGGIEALLARFNKMVGVDPDEQG